MPASPSGRASFGGADVDNILYQQNDEMKRNPVGQHVVRPFMGSPKNEDGEILLNADGTPARFSENSPPKRRSNAKKHSESPLPTDLLPIENHYHPKRYGVQSWRVFRIQLPPNLQKELHRFMDHEPSLTESISYWGSRMTEQFAIPRNLILTILTDFCWVNCLILIENVITGKLSGIKKACGGGADDFDTRKAVNAHSANMRKDYMQEMAQLRERVRFPGGAESEAASAKQAFESKMNELCGGDEVSFQSDDKWANLSKADQEMIDKMTENKVAASWHRR